MVEFYYRMILIIIPSHGTPLFQTRTLSIMQAYIYLIPFIPRLGEIWDGKYPIYEYYIPDIIQWESINTADISEEISKLYDQYEELVTHGVLN